MAETEIVTLDAQAEVTYEWDEHFAPVEITDPADGSGIGWSGFLAEINRLEQQVAGLTYLLSQKMSAWDSVSPGTLPRQNNGRFMLEWCDPKSGNGYKDQIGILVYVNNQKTAFLTYPYGL